MNALSSLLNWIGNTIGANPSTLRTSSKTLVGAINEVDFEKPEFNNTWINPNSTVTMNFPNVTEVQQYLVMLSGNAAPVKGMYLISLTTAGDVNYSPVLEATGATLTASNRKLAIRVGDRGTRLAVIALQRGFMPTFTT